MSRGRRFEKERKLNLKKVFAFIIAIIIIVMFVIGVKKILSQNKDDKITAQYYFSAFENNKYGVIDSEGKTIIEPAYAELVVIPNNSKDVFLCTYDVDYNTGKYKTKVLNSKNEEILKDYENVEPLENFDENNNLKYNQNILKVQKNGKYGLVTIDGKEILECSYDKINSLIGNENSILVEKDGKVGLVDEKGTTVIDTKYKEIKKLDDDYKNGYIVIDENNKYGTIDCANNIVLETKYTDIKPIYNNNIYIVKGTNGYNAVDNKGNILTKKEYEDIKDIKNEELIVKENGKYGVIKTTGEQVVSCSYDDIDFSFDSKAYIAKRENKYGIIEAETKNTKLEFKYSFMEYIKQADIVEASEDGIESQILDNNYEVKLTGIVSEINTEKGYIKIRIDDNYKYYNFKFEEKKYSELYTNNTIFLDKKDGKYGYVNKDGIKVVDYIYDDAKEQNEYGFAAVNKDGKWGSIDKSGNIISSIDKDLASNAVIDFIGNWYLMKDANLKCYTK